MLGDYRVCVQLTFPVASVDLNSSLEMIPNARFVAIKVNPCSRSIVKYPSR